MEHRSKTISAAKQKRATFQSSALIQHKLLIVIPLEACAASANIDLMAEYSE